MQQFIESDWTLTVRETTNIANKWFDGLDSALEFLDGYIISPGVRVTISITFNANQHTYFQDSEIVIKHPQASQIFIQAGSNPVSYDIVGVEKVVHHHAEWHEVMLEVDGASAFSAISDWHMAFLPVPEDGTLTGDYEQIFGMWPILYTQTVDSKNYVHILVASQSDSFEVAPDIVNASDSFVAIRTVLRFTKSAGLLVQNTLGEYIDDWTGVSGNEGLQEVALVGPRGIGGLVDVTVSDGVISAIDIVNVGMNYSTDTYAMPEIQFSQGSEASVSLTILDKAVCYVVVTNGGQDYALGDTVEFEDASQAAGGAFARVTEIDGNGAIVAMLVYSTSSYNDYSAPSVYGWTTTSGTGASVVAVVKDGAIGSVSFSGGSGYANQSNAKVQTPELIGNNGGQKRKAHGLVVGPGAGVQIGRYMGVFGFPSSGFFAKENADLYAPATAACACGANGYYSLNGSQVIVSKAVSNGNDGVGMTTATSDSMIATGAYVAGNGTQGIQSDTESALLAPLAHMVGNRTGAFAIGNSTLDIRNAVFKSNTDYGIRSSDNSFVDATGVSITGVSGDTSYGIHADDSSYVLFNSGSVSGSVTADLAAVSGSVIEAGSATIGGSTSPTANEIGPQGELVRTGTVSARYIGGALMPDGSTNNIGSTSVRWNNIYLNNAPDYPSDYRIKTDVVDLEAGLAALMSLRPISYRRTDIPDEQVHAGLVAQDVRKLVEASQLPEGLLGGNGLKDNVDETILSLRYGELIPVLVRGIQELSEEVDRLKRKLNN